MSKMIPCTSKTEELFILIRHAICFLGVCQTLMLAPVCLAVRESHYLHWNTSNPIFRIDNTDHIIDVNRGNQAWEYDQVNIICPLYKPGTPPQDIERYVIYSVSKEEYESCRITDPHPRAIAKCNNPHTLLYFTITFRSFTPTPGGMEFQPGRDYYFISTSGQEDLHRRVGGRCSTHNMKVQFKVADNRHETAPPVLQRAVNNPRYRPHQPHLEVPRSHPEPKPPRSTSPSAASTNSSATHPPPRRPPYVPGSHGYIQGGKLPMYYGDLSYYDNASEKKRHEYEVHPNDIIKHEASRMAPASAGTSQPRPSTCAIISLLTLVPTTILYRVSSLEHFF
eukprot:snap_masked-scaffold1242_size53651-processed-gene-0.4 protein:Tk09038 transcript:snap_masked-scaffold1242_size53651-processed-gene-0.4-mRNA-1 annotation:"PREDICTED: ephrin-B1"